MSLEVTIENRNGKTLLSSPYNQKLVQDARQIGGRYNIRTRAWEFDERDRRRVERLAAKYFGYAPENTGKVTLHIKASDYVGDREDGNKIILAGRVIARRDSRDSPVKYADGVICYKGNFPKSAGSIASPRIFAYVYDPSPTLEVRNLPVAALDVIDKPYTIVAGDPAQSLRDEKTRLLERLAEINKKLGE